MNENLKTPYDCFKSNLGTQNSLGGSEVHACMQLYNIDVWLAELCPSI
jgi:hypothetical protein